MDTLPSTEPPIFRTILLISGISILLTIWATGVLVFLMASEKSTCPKCGKKMKASSIKGHLANPNLHGDSSSSSTASKADYSTNYSGLGGELQRLEDKFEGAELVFAKAAYDRGDPRHKDAKDQLKQLRRREARQ